MAHHLVDLEYIIVGGLLVGIIISLATNGTSGLTDPRTWAVGGDPRGRPSGVCLKYIDLVVARPLFLPYD